MSDEVIRSTPEATGLAVGERKPDPPMISPNDFTGTLKSTAALMDAVVASNLRATLELLRVDSPETVLELQRRFVSEYMTVLMQGTMTLVGAIEAAGSK